MVVLVCCATLARCGSCPYTGDSTDEDSSGCPFADLRMPDASEALKLLGTRVSPDPGQMTAKGCACKISCRTSPDDAFKCDWCYTKDNCGSFGFGGSWDYCVYPETNKAFESLSFQEKNKIFWSRLTADKKRSDHAELATVFITDVQTPFSNFKDEMPAGRVRTLHGVGAVCQFRLDIAPDSPYTGLFAPGPQDGFVRLAPAVKWKKDGAGYAPGLAMKFARTGIRSGNILALPNLQVATFNFFKYNLSNHIAPAKTLQGKLLMRKFGQASQCPVHVGVSDMATWTQNGTKVDVPKFPFKLFLVPSAEVHQPDTPKDLDDVMRELQSLKKGTKLMAVYACAKGNGDAENQPSAGGLEVACGEPFKLGDMVTTTECSTSAYGDKKFFFRHQLIEEDWLARPEFLDQFDTKTVCMSSTKPTPTGVPKRCGGQQWHFLSGVGSHNGVVFLCINFFWIFLF